MYKNNVEIIPYDQYFNELIITGTFAGQYELLNASMLLNCNIIIYKNENYDHSGITYNFIYETVISADDVLNPFKHLILIGWVNNNHYILLYPKNF